MENLPSNSRFPKEDGKEAPPGERKLERVTVNEVTRGKKPMSRRFLDTFVKGDSTNVFEWVLMEVIVPGARDMIADAVTQGIERMIFGESRSVSRRANTRPSGANGYVNYNRISSATRPSSTYGQPREERRHSVSYDFQPIVFASRAEGEEVIRRMFMVVEKYHSICVYDLYELVGLAGNPVDYKWGWTDIRSAKLLWTKAGYMLDIQPPDPLD